MIKYVEMSNDELYDYLAKNSHLISGASSQLKYVNFSTLEGSVYNLVALDSSSGRDILVGAAALEDMRAFGYSRGLNVKYISVLPDFQKQGIGSSLAKGLARYVKSQGDCLTQRPVSEGGMALTSLWQSLSQELDLEILMTLNSSRYFPVNYPEEKVKLFRGSEIPQSVVFREDGVDCIGKFISLASLADLTTVVRVYFDEKEFVKSLDDVVIHW